MPSPRPLFPDAKIESVNAHVKPKMSPGANGRYVISAPFDFCVITTAVQSITCRIPAGFVFDGASIPRFAWRVVGHPFASDIVTAALIHDYLYATELFQRIEADTAFLQLMKRDGVGFLRRRTCYFAVRLFGGIVWSHHTPASIHSARNPRLCYELEK